MRSGYGAVTAMSPTPRFTPSVLAIAIGLTALAHAQEPTAPPAPSERPPAAEAAPSDLPPLDGPPPFGPGGPGAPGRPGRGGPGFGMMQDRKVLAEFDKDGNGRLDSTERKAAREFLEKEQKDRPRGFGPGGRGPGGPGGGPGGFPGGPGGGPGRRGNQPPPEPGPKLAPAEVASHRGVPLYDEATYRTLFFDFEGDEWEKELAAFHRTDVEVPAKLTVDGVTYPEVGVHFRGMSSFMMIGEGRKRSLNVSIDEFNSKQQLGGYRTLNLLNSNGDPTYLRAVLFHHIARHYIPSPKANFVRVVLNGENWGTYVNVQQFNKDFVAEWFGTSKGARWKAPGSPRGNSGLEYLGDDAAEYKKRFEIKSKDDAQSWTALIDLCRVLNQTPAEQLEEALAPILDIDGTLKYLALDNVMINTDGYWTRASDYNLYRDPAGKFHIIPHDVNETFQTPEGPGMRENRPKGVELDPLAGSKDADKPLLSKLLAVPSLRTRYLGYVRAITEEWLDWNKLAPLVAQYQALIADDVKASTRNLASVEAFTKGATEDLEEQGFRGPRQSISLKSFVEQRREFLLNHPEVKGALAAVTNH